MRYLGIAAMAVLVVIATAGPADAGFFHSGGTLNCPDCHTMHYSQQHGYNADGTGFFNPLGPGGPFEHLLRDEINTICLSCHDQQTFAPDVFEANANTATGGPRQAGGLNEVGGNAQYPPTTGHTLGSLDVPPGNDGSYTVPADGLNCAECHAVHGGGFGIEDAYRNLGGYGTAVGSGNRITFASGAANTDLTVDVFVNTSSGVALNKYQQANVIWNEPDSADSAVARVCKGCHTDFHGAVGDATTIGGHGSPAEGFIRHPAAGVDIGVIGGGHSSLGVLAAHAPNQVQAMSPTGKAAGAYDATDTALTPTCISCHKGHGNQNAFGLIYMLGSDRGGGTITEQGDGGTSVRDLCKQCHVQGGE
jgi:hypothetical protein